MKFAVKAAAAVVGLSTALSLGAFGIEAASAQQSSHEETCKYFPKRAKYNDIRSGEAAFQLACLILQSQGVPACAENYQDVKTGKPCLPQDVQDKLKKKDKKDDGKENKGGGGGRTVIVTLPTIHVYGTTTRTVNPKVTVGPVENVE
jgi:hypothetical protein